MKHPVTGNKQDFGSYAAIVLKIQVVIPMFVVDHLDKMDFKYQNLDIKV